MKNPHSEIMQLLSELPDEQSAIDQLKNSAGQSIKPLTEKELIDTRVQYESDPDTVVRRWGERRNTLKDEYRYRRLFHALYNRAYEGCALETANLHTGKVEPIGLPGWFPNNSIYRVEFPRLRPIVNEIQAELTAARGRLEVNARSSSQRDMDGARAANKLVWYFNERKEMRGLEARAALGGIIYGECYIKTEWDERQVVCVKNAEDEIERGMFGDVKFSVVSPGRLYVNKTAKELSDAEWVIEERILSRTELERQWPEAAQYLKPQDPQGEDWDDDDARFYFFDSRSEMEDAYDSTPSLSDLTDCDYRVYECYEKSFDEDAGYIWHRTVICRGKILEQGIYQPLNLADEPVTDIYGNVVYWDLPYTHWRYNEVMDKYHGQGVMRDALKPVRFLNWLDLLMAKIASDSAWKIMVMPMDATNTPVYENGFLEYRTLDKEHAPEFLDSGTFPSIIIEQVRYYDEMLREITMRPDVVRGEAPANRSGKAINTLSAEAKGMFDGIRRRFDECWLAAYEKALRLASVMYTETRVLGINEDDAAGSFTIKGMDFQNYADVRMDYAPFYGHTKAERMEFMAQMVEMQAYTPEEFKQITKAGNYEEIVDMPELQSRRGREVIYAIQSMPEQVLTNIALAVEQSQQQIGMQAEAGAFDPSEMDAKLNEAANDILKQYDIGIGIYDDPMIQASQIQRAALMNRFRTSGEAAQAILTLRFEICMALAAEKMASVQQVEQQQQQP